MKEKTKFELKKEHIKMAERLVFETVYSPYCKYVPGINPKRPFGNSSVYEDVCDILGYECNDDGDYKKEDMMRAKRFIIELPVALEIMLTQHTFTPGIYDVDLYGGGYGSYFQYKEAIQDEIEVSEDGTN